jgi:hypothetical protein
MAKQSEMARVLANIDAQIAELQAARRLITEAQAQHPPRVRRKPKPAKDSHRGTTVETAD